jgi:uncharacterized protein
MGSNLDATKQLYEAMGKGDVPTVLGLMDEKIDWQEPASLPFGNQIGPQAVVEGVFGPLFAMFPNFSVTTREIHDAGDVVVGIGTYRGTSAKTGSDFEAEFVHVWRFKDGKISGFRTYTDTHDWLKSIGEA